MDKNEIKIVDLIDYCKERLEVVDNEVKARGYADVQSIARLIEINALKDFLLLKMVK